MADKIMEVRDIVKKYDKKTALDGVTFDLQKGRILGLLGPNGSGKSTMLKLAAGLVRKDAGTIKVCGLEPGVASKSKIAYLAEVDCLYPWMKVKQFLEFIPEFYDDWDNRKSEELMAFFKLEKDAIIKQLSKGMRAKLKILLAFSRNASLILLDEPLSGIDYPSRAKIVETIIKHFKEKEQSIILSTHEIIETEGVFDDVVMLEYGRIKLMGQAEDLREEYKMSITELLKEVYPA